MITSLPVVDAAPVIDPSTVSFSAEESALIQLGRSLRLMMALATERHYAYHFIEVLESSR